ncbi:MAG: methyltransferase domain-containing protein [Acidobacteria bacterium]|nr:methyltransferase domain-containing protein [Acidobacteriota bacterium]
MAGVRLGERVLQAGVGNLRAFAVMAGKAGLTGRACAVVDTPAAARTIETAAAREGVLIEVATAEGGRWPFEPSSFDLGLTDGNVLLAASPGACQERLRDMYRVVRPGGRVLAVYQKRYGLVARLGFERAEHGPSAQARALATALSEAGWRPVRVLAEREGMAFVEGFRPTVI